MGKARGEKPEAPDSAGDTASTGRRVAGARIEALKAAGTVGTVGLSFILAIVIGGLLGAWLDRVTGWTPVLFWVFLVIGLLAGIRNVIVILKRYGR